MCNAKKCGQYPLTLSVEQMEELQVEYNASFMKGILEKIEYYVVLDQAKLLNIQLPQNVEDCDLELLHKVLLGIEITQGQMTCDKCQHIFKITDGIPNMLLNPNEV